MTRKAASPKPDARDRLRRVLFLVPYAVRRRGPGGGGIGAA